jgi:hypothetical protein
MVRNVVTTQGGGDYQFPKDQILLVLKRSNTYKELPQDKDRELGNLSNQKTYLVWYHHLWTEAECRKKRANNQAPNAKGGKSSTRH